MSSEIDRKKFYKFTLFAHKDISAPYLITETEFTSIHETEHMHFCVCSGDVRILEYNATFPEHVGKSLIQVASELNWIKVRRIHKNGSRIAFATRKEAFNHLRLLKHHQIKHLTRTLHSINEFLKIETYEQFKSTRSDWMIMT